jgi:hypothetical protein
MKKLILITVILIAAALLLVAQPKPPAMGNKPVVVELFTSQGCSSCPPADELLAELSRDPRIIPLAFHVDYWDHLGWRDPFSSRQWTERQTSYVRVMNLSSAYTPQAVVDGSRELVGSDRGALYDAISRASHDPAEASLTITGGVARGSTPRELDLFAVTTQKNATTAVKAGENEGRTLRSDAIVRKLTRVARVNGTFAQPVSEANVAFLQDPKTLKIYAVAAR